MGICVQERDPPGPFCLPKQPAGPQAVQPCTATRGRLPTARKTAPALTPHPPAPPRPMGSPAPGKPIPELSVPPAGPTAEGLVWGRHAHWTSLGTHTIFHLLLSPPWPTYRKGWDAHPSPPGLGAYPPWKMLTVLGSAGGMGESLGSGDGWGANYQRESTCPPRPPPGPKTGCGVGA